MKHDKKCNQVRHDQRDMANRYLTYCDGNRITPAKGGISDQDAKAQEAR